MPALATRESVCDLHGNLNPDNFRPRPLIF
jgi:hypothetical protein